MQSPQTIVPVGTKTTFVEVWKWGQELECLHARIAPRFVRPEPRRRALAFLKSIVSTTERKHLRTFPRGEFRRQILRTFPTMGMLSSGDQLLRRLKWSGEDSISH